MTSEYSVEHDPIGHTSGALRVPQEMMQTYAQLRDYLKREMGRMLAAEGRGADAHLAHLATGEMVLPRRLLDGDPWLRTYLVRMFEDAGLDWRMHLVGGNNRINPKTGLPEFDPFDTHDDLGGGFGGGFNAGEGYDNPNTDIDFTEGYDNPNTDIAGFDSGYGSSAGSRNVSDVGGQGEYPGVSDPFNVDTSFSVKTGGIGGATSIGGQTPQHRNYLTQVRELASSGLPRNALISGLLGQGSNTGMSNHNPNTDIDLGPGFGAPGGVSRESSFGVNTDWNPFDYQSSELDDEAKESMRLANRVIEAFYEVPQLEDLYDHPFRKGVTNENSYREFIENSARTAGIGRHFDIRRYDIADEVLEDAVGDFMRFWNRRLQQER